MTGTPPVLGECQALLDKTDRLAAGNGRQQQRQQWTSFHSLANGYTLAMYHETGAYGIRVD